MFMFCWNYRYHPWKSFPCVRSSFSITVFIFHVSILSIWNQLLNYLKQQRNTFESTGAYHIHEQIIWCLSFHYPYIYLHFRRYTWNKQYFQYSLNVQKMYFISQQLYILTQHFCKQYESSSEAFLMCCLPALLANMLCVCHFHACTHWPWISVCHSEHQNTFIHVLIFHRKTNASLQSIHNVHVHNLWKMYPLSYLLHE